MDVCFLSCLRFPKSVEISKIFLTLPLHNPDFLFRQAVKFVHQAVDLGVGEQGAEAPCWEGCRYGVIRPPQS